jgi:ABC-type dipeptide/oligopeptide/nickel transport system permease subunit
MSFHVVCPATNGTLFLLGTDRLGRDVLSRILYGARISLTIGLIGIPLSFTLGLVIGGIAGYDGGWVSMILGETALSFLGIGLRPPITSWGVLLNEAQNINVVALYPWLMLPVVPVIIVILAFNFFGDGLRDASDPYR